MDIPLCVSCDAVVDAVVVVDVVTAPEATANFFHSLTHVFAIAANDALLCSRNFAALIPTLVRYKERIHINNKV